MTLRLKRIFRFHLKLLKSNFSLHPQILYSGTAGSWSQTNNHQQICGVCSNASIFGLFGLHQLLKNFLLFFLACNLVDECMKIEPYSKCAMRLKSSLFLQYSLVGTTIDSIMSPTWQSSFHHLTANPKEHVRNGEIGYRDQHNVFLL